MPPMAKLSARARKSLMRLAGVLILTAGLLALTLYGMKLALEGVLAPQYYNADSPP